MTVENEASENKTKTAITPVSNDIDELGKYLDLNTYRPDSVMYVLKASDESYELEAILFLNNQTLEKMREVERTIEWVNYDANPQGFLFGWIPEKISNQIKLIESGTGTDGHAEFYFKALKGSKSLWLNDMMIIKTNNK